MAVFSSPGKRYNGCVDVFLAEEARLFLAGLNAGPARSRPRGLLLGHIRGPRFFVEQVFPAAQGFAFRSAEVRRLDALFGDRVLGFFAFDAPPSLRRRLLRPEAVGRLLVSLAARSGREPAATAHLVDFDGRFKLVRLPLARVPEVRGHG